MKTLIFSFLCLSLLSHASVNAQDISLSNLIAIRDGSVETANSILLGKGWLFKGLEENIYSQNGCEYKQTVWDFEPNNSSDAAKGFINLYTNSNCQAFVGYVIFNLTSYQKIRQAVEKYGMHLVNSRTERDNDNGSPYTESTFAGAKYKVVIQVVNNSESREGTKNMYQIYIYKK